MSYPHRSKMSRSSQSYSLVAIILVLLIFSILSIHGALSLKYQNVWAQSDISTTQKRIDEDRASQASDSTAAANKLRQVAGDRIPNHYIVVLKDMIVPSTSVRPLAEEARNQGAELRHVYENAIRGYAIRIPNQDVLDSILRNPAVDYVQQDVKLKAFVQTLPTGIDRADGDLSSTKSGDGTGTVNIDIAILDTGIDLDHPDLNVFREETFVSGTTTANDDDGHGTLVAGVAAARDDSNGVVGMAPGARLWAVKVLDSNGEGFNSDIIAGIDYITANADEIDTVNLSFGGDGPDNALHTAIANSVAAGVTYVAAAGNEDQDAGSQVPASYPEVITVSAIVDTDGKCGGLGFSTTAGDDDTFADFSNFGSVIDMAAPGVLVKTTARGGSTASFSGTSASTPHVTGAAALYEATHPGATPSGIRDALRSSGSTASTVCDGKGHGYLSPPTGDPDGIAEPLLYVASGSSPPPPPPGDATPPTVVSTNPSSGATGIAVTSSITGTFSEAVQSSTVSSTTFTLKAGTTSIPGTVTLSADAKTATFDPTSSLAASTSYTATITTGVKDLAGNAMTSAKSWSFTTAAAAPPPSSSCNNLAISGATSSATQSSFPPSNAIDNNANTKWWSTFSVNPWIRADLGASKSICSVDIAWADGASRQYSFTISVSTDGSSFTNVFTGKSKGTTTSPEKYSFAEALGRYVKITITQSHVGSASSIAQISELDIIGKASTSAITSKSLTEDAMPTSGIRDDINQILRDEGSSLSSNHAPVAKDDRIRSESNKLVLAKVLDNDKDPDDDKLTIISVSSPTKKGGIATINENGTITFSPADDFTGLDTFSYDISDGKGESDKAKVFITIKAVSDSRSDQAEQQVKTTREQEARQEATAADNKELNNKDDKNELGELTAQSVKNNGLTNDTHNSND